jgi:hypothetical protein
MSIKAHDLEGYRILESEARACGVIYVEFVAAWTEEFARFDALTMPQHPRCMACECRPDMPAAFVNVFAGKDATVSMPMPVCEGCVHQTKRLQRMTRKILAPLLPGVPVDFVIAEPQ